jgi:hypothetical protein
MRAWTSGLMIAAAVAACAPGGGGGQIADRSECVGLFREFDVIERTRPVDRRTWGGREQFDPWLSNIAQRLRQNDCVTRTRDIGDVDAVEQAWLARPVVEGGAPLGGAVAVHVGVFAGEADAARAVALFRAQGLRATSVGNPLLGRRVYAGPVQTAQALDAVLGIAFEAGYIAPYPSEFFRF